ncbi:MAG TPA: hypothetical protein PLD27_00525 [bacterium]|nr:hypothetical protein [bacterium]HOL47215.1 hypothetical protein [bacterium]HPQ18276.1 hypothetical protein [bacterium]
MCYYSLIDYINLREYYYQNKIDENEFKKRFKELQKKDKTPYNDKEKIVIKEIYKEIAGWSIF